MVSNGKALSWSHRIASFLERVVLWGARHWLGMLNFALFIYVTLPVLAPTFMAWGWESLGRIIYTVYIPLCHQLPERSFFLFGPKIAYSLSELQAHGLDPSTPMWARRFFLGTPELGYKMAFCQRDFALYGAMWLGGVLFALSGRRWKPLAWRWFVLAWVPMALDGGTQLLGIRESTWPLRVFTGVLAGGALVWTLYPRLEQAFSVSFSEGHN